MRSEITTIIFSKNRACQLELLLRNLNMPATVLYTYDPEFRLGYEKLISLYSSVKFIRETNFKKQLVENIREYIGEYIMFLVDDDIMIEYFNEDCPEFIEFKKNQDIVCLSLRISPEYNRAPILKNNTWRWKGERKDWGYPMSVTSSIFRKQDILPIIINKEINTPHDLEKQLKSNIPVGKPLMMCFDKPKIINNLANQVQVEHPNRNLGVSLNKLEERFLKGGLLSLSDIKEKAKESKSCFLMVDYKWENHWLSIYRKNIFSQRGEDGVLEKIFEVLNISRGWCVDVGAYGKELSNTYNLMKKEWSGIFIEKDTKRIKNLEKIYGKNNNAYCINKTIGTEGINSFDNILKEYSLSRDFEFLNIDIDGNDYYVWESIKSYTPLVVVIEFNPTFDFDNYVQTIDGEGGASLSAIVKLGKLKGYELIATTEFNAFFVRKDLFGKFNINDNSVDKLFVKNNSSYGKKFRNNKK